MRRPDTSRYILPVWNRCRRNVKGRKGNVSYCEVLWDTLKAINWGGKATLPNKGSYPSSRKYSLLGHSNTGLQDLTLWLCLICHNVVLRFN